MTTRWFANFEIDGYPFGCQMGRYQRWHFVRSDRVIRPETRERHARYQARYNHVENLSNWHEPDEYLYLTTAEILRQRLAAAGFHRTTLELEFLEYLQVAFKFPHPRFASTHEEGIKARKAEERAATIRRAGLDDWLFALRVVMSKDLTVHNSRMEDIAYSDPNIDINVLVDETSGFLGWKDISPRIKHLLGFPCFTLESMAVAMLEVTEDDAECILDVSDLVRTNRAYSFEDLVVAKKNATQSKDVRPIQH
ncbi:HEPN/Toprim-associated domain-containing protein [Paraburkholderia bryophila]|nr:HEPN/Toprim-associated domain-containing protein [Paraburkholderia bryophila]